MRVELFHLREDPSERKDLARQMPEKTATLRRQLHDWRQGVHADMPVRNPNYDPAAVAPGRRGTRKTQS